MFRFFPLIIILQGFCIYHAHKNNTLQRWFFIILFLPFIGSLIYLYTHFYSKRNIENLSEGMKSVFNTNYQIEKLEKERRVADTVVNRSRLADEYVNVGRVDEAAALYQTCLEGLNADDPDILLKMLKVSFLQKNYLKAIECGDKLKEEHTFRNAEERVAYAWSLFKNGDVAAAELNFKAMDARFSNYMHRMEFSKFLKETNNPTASKALLTELIEEYDHMDGYEQKLKKPIFKEIKQLFRES